MQALPDYLVIETYGQFAAVVAIAVAVLAGVMLQWRSRRARRARTATLIGSQRPVAPTPKREPSAKPMRNAKGMDFDRLAVMIADASDRAGHISETQSAAALKLDTAEMAVNRLIADIDTVMAMPKTARPATMDSTAPAAPRSTIAA